MCLLPSTAELFMVEECCTCSSQTGKSTMSLSCTGVKVLLAGEQQAAVTVAVEGLMDGKPLPELESFLTLDPKVLPPLLPSPLTGWLWSESLLLCCHCISHIGAHPALKLRHVRHGPWRWIYVLHVKRACSRMLLQHCAQSV